MSLLVASLYLLCLAFLLGSALYVYSLDPFARLNASYAVLALALLGWVGSLFVFSNQTVAPSLLSWGRFNFAAAALVGPAVCLFVAALARSSLSQRWIWVESGVLALLSFATGLVHRAETVLPSGEHVTTYGPLFPLYALHLVLFLLAALFLAFRPTRSLSRKVIGLLRLVGVGLLLSAAIGITTNVVLPYLLGDFRFINVGTLSTIFFLSAVAYAACVHHLFNVQVLIRKTLVFALLIAFALELYQAAVEFLTKLLPLGDPAQRHIAAATVALIINAFTHEPLRRLLEQLTDRLLARKRGTPAPRHHSHRERRVS